MLKLVIFQNHRQVLPMMKDADLHPPDLDRVTGRPL